MRTKDELFRAAQREVAAYRQQAVFRLQYGESHLQPAVIEQCAEHAARLLVRILLYIGHLAGEWSRKRTAVEIAASGL